MAEDQQAAPTRTQFHFRSVAAISKKNISPNLVMALQHAKTVGAKIMGVVGRDGGYTARSPTRACRANLNPENVTPHPKHFRRWSGI